MYTSSSVQVCLEKILTVFAQINGVMHRRGSDGGFERRKRQFNTGVKMKVGGVRTCYILPSDCHLQEENKGQWRVLESYLHLDPGEVDNYSGHQTEKSGQEY